MRYRKWAKQFYNNDNVGNLTSMDDTSLATVA